MQQVTLTETEEKFQRYPKDLSESLREAWTPVSNSLSDEEMVAWVDWGLAIAQQAGRSWEAAREYFRASPAAVRALPFVHLKQWGYWGNSITEESPAAAGAYFRASPRIVASLKPWDVSEWAQIGKRLYGRGRRSGVLTTRYFEVSGDLLSVLTFSELQHLVTMMESIAERSVDEASSFLSLSSEVLPTLREDTRSCLSLISALLGKEWQQATGCLQVVGESLARVERVERSRYLSLVGRIAGFGGVNVPSFLRDSSSALGQLDGYVHVHVLNMADSLSRIDHAVVLDYLKGVPQVLRRVSINQLETWYETGVAILKENPEGGAAYFKGESSRSEEVLEKLSTGVELGRVKEVMRLYSRALSAQDVEIAAHQAEEAKGRGWVALEKMMAEGATVYLPPVAERFGNKGDNFDWYKVVATHQVARLEFESFNFSFERQPTQFEDRQMPVPSAEDEDADAQDDRAVGLADIQRFFGLFEYGDLVRDIFTAVEDFRLDYRVKAEYPGIRRAYSKVQLLELSERPRLEDLPVREAMVELLIRFSLQQGSELMVPEPFAASADVLWKLVRPLSSTQATVEDSAEATYRMYEIISQVPNQEVPEEEWQQGDFPDEQTPSQSMSDEEWEQMMRELMEAQQQFGDGEEQPYESPPPVDYRGEFKPELMQVISMLRESQRERGAKGETISKGEMERLLAEANKPVTNNQGVDPQRKGMFVSDLVKELGSRGTPQGAIQQTTMAYDPSYDEEEQGGPLEIKEPASFLYDEWDYRMSDYRSRWCLLREKDMSEGDATYFSATLDGYAALASQIRRQFELMVPQGLQKVKRQQDGDELELGRRDRGDDGQALRDIAVGEGVREAQQGPAGRGGCVPDGHERVHGGGYRRVTTPRGRVGRAGRPAGVHVLAAQPPGRGRTAQLQAYCGPGEGEPGAPHPRAGDHRRHIWHLRLLRLRARERGLLRHQGRPGGAFRQGEAPDRQGVPAAGDANGPGHSPRCDQAGPAGGAHQVPGAHQRRAAAGPPATAAEGVEKEYAIHDTRVALLETRRRGITPFCLTVDKEGHDYLRSMCQDMGYEVLADIHSLPRRLPALYRSLTV